MRMVFPVALSYALLLAQGANAQQANVQHSQWVIVETIIDKASGKPLHEATLDDPDLLFDSPDQCQSILDKIPPLVSTTTMTFVLKCRKIRSPKAETL